MIGWGWGTYCIELESHSQEERLDTMGQIVRCAAQLQNGNLFHTVLVCCPVFLFIVSCFVNSICKLVNLWHHFLSAHTHIE